LYDVGVAANNDVNTLTLQHLGKAALFAILMSFILIPPMHAGDYTVDAIAIYSSEVALYDYGVNEVYMLALGYGDAVCAVGIVYKGEAYAMALET
jgi:hypothetical protein